MRGCEQLNGFTISESITANWQIDQLEVQGIGNQGVEETGRRTTAAKSVFGGGARHVLADDVSTAIGGSPDWAVTINTAHDQGGMACIGLRHLILKEL